MGISSGNQALTRWAFLVTYLVRLPTTGLDSMGCHSWESGTSVRNVRKAPHVYEGCSKEGLPVIRAKDYPFVNVTLLFARGCPRRISLLLNKKSIRTLFVAKSDHGIDL